MVVIKRVDCSIYVAVDKHALLLRQLLSNTLWDDLPSLVRKYVRTYESSERIKCQTKKKKRTQYNINFQNDHKRQGNFIYYVS